MKRWEYKFLPDLSQPNCNELGAEGWELVSVTQVAGGVKFWYFFKRLLED